MRALGFDVKKADVLKILKDYDREATGKITFEDFNEVGMYLILYLQKTTFRGTQPTVVTGIWAEYFVCIFSYWFYWEIEEGDRISYFYSET